MHQHSSGSLLPRACLVTGSCLCRLAPCLFAGVTSGRSCGLGILILVYASEQPEAGGICGLGVFSLVRGRHLQPFDCCAVPGVRPDPWGAPTRCLSYIRDSISCQPEWALRISLCAPQRGEHKASLSGTRVGLQTGAWQQYWAEC